MALNFATFFPNIDLGILHSQGITCGIKIQIDNQAPFVSTFRQEAMELDETLATCLSPVFSSQSIPCAGISKVQGTMGHFVIGTPPDENISYASIEAIESDNIYDLNIDDAPIALVAHTPKLLMYNFNRSIAPPSDYENDPTSWVAHIESLSDTERANLYATELNKKIITEKHTITLLRKSSSDDYLDLFEILSKSKKVTQPIKKFELNPAIVQADKIVFTSLCQMKSM